MKIFKIYTAYFKADLSQKQLELFTAAGLLPVAVGATDAFDPDYSIVKGYQAFMAVHPMIFAHFCGGNGYAEKSQPDAWRTGFLFRNGARSDEGNPTIFDALELWALTPRATDDGSGGLQSRCVAWFE